MHRSILGLVFLTAACSATGPTGNNSGFLTGVNSETIYTSAGRQSPGAGEDERIARVTRSVFSAAAELCGQGTLGNSAAPAGKPIAGAVCAMPIVVTQSGNIVASTNGERVRISKGFIDLTGSDDELAFVIAHEMAHILLRHKVKLGDGDRRAQEHEADTLALYIAIRAGYDGSTSIGILPRLAGFLRNDTVDSRHPTFSDRQSRLTAQVSRIYSIAGMPAAARRQMAANEIVGRFYSDAAQ